MPDADDFDGGLILKFKKQPVVAAAEPKASLRRLELLYVAVASSEVAVSAMKNIESSLAVDAAQIGAGFFGPTDGNARGGLLLAHRPNSRRTSS